MTPRETEATQALYHLRRAREHLKLAGTPNTLKRVRLAITSCGGAIRHLANEPARIERKERT